MCVCDVVLNVFKGTAYSVKLLDVTLGIVLVALPRKAKLVPFL